MESRKTLKEELINAIDTKSGSSFLVYSEGGNTDAVLKRLLNTNDELSVLLFSESSFYGKRNVNVFDRKTFKPSKKAVDRSLMFNYGYKVVYVVDDKKMISYTKDYLRNKGIILVGITTDPKYYQKASENFSFSFDGGNLENF